jgi:hypothetical protein
LYTHLLPPLSISVALQVTYLMHKPMLPFLTELEDACALPIDPQPNIFARFAASAQNDPSAASGIRVTVHVCTGLVLSTDPAAARTYIQYEFPGYPAAVDSAVRVGADPVFEESRIFEFGPNPQTAPAFCEALRVSMLSLVVFDATGEGDDTNVGICHLSLQYAPPTILNQLSHDCSALESGSRSQASRFQVPLSPEVRMRHGKAGRWQIETT